MSDLSSRDPGAPRRIPAPLSPAACRVLGSLLEKQVAVPDSYPLTLVSLAAACNQTTNRDPVLRLSEAEILEALRELMRDALVRRREGGRVERWEQNVERRWRVTPAGRAVLTLLLLRGAQTAGELRGRAERLHPFGSIGEVEATLGELAAGEEPMVRSLPREPGRKEARWTHLFNDSAPRTDRVAPSPAREPVSSVGANLESRVADLERRLAELEARLG
jgi:uncharacterized protein YceH (UPF0502 family)